MNGIFSTIAPTSPDPSTYSGFPEDQDDWGCEHWKEYHKRNKNIYGSEVAKSIILTDSDNVGWFADIHLCKYDCDFVDYFEKELGESVGNIFSKIYCVGSEVVEAGDSLVSGAHGGIKIASFLLPIAVIGGVALAANYAYKTYGKK